MDFQTIHQRISQLICLVIFAVFLTSCSSDDRVDSIKQGQILFNQKHIGKNKVIGCVACHSIKPGQKIIGPSLAGLSLRAPYLIPGKTAEDYIRESIVNPDAYIVAGFLPAIMFPHYAQELRPEEIDNLVAYLSHL